MNLYELDKAYEVLQDELLCGDLTVRIVYIVGGYLSNYNKEVII